MVFCENLQFFGRVWPPLEGKDELGEEDDENILTILETKGCYLRQNNS